MKFSMTGQDKGDLLIQVTTWAGLTVYTILSEVDRNLITCKIICTIDKSQNIVMCV
jgi:hypothetical protein